MYPLNSVEIPTQMTEEQNFIGVITVGFKQHGNTRIVKESHFKIHKQEKFRKVMNSQILANF